MFDTRPLRKTAGDLRSSLVGERAAAGVAEHVQVGLELQAGACGRAVDHPGEAGRVKGEPRSLTNTNGAAVKEVEEHGNLVEAEAFAAAFSGLATRAHPRLAQIEEAWRAA
jgi:hypothetical protein